MCQTFHLPYKVNMTVSFYAGWTPVALSFKGALVRRGNPSPELVLPLRRVICLRLRMLSDYHCQAPHSGSSWAWLFTSRQKAELSVFMKSALWLFM